MVESTVQSIGLGLHFCTIESTVQSIGLGLWLSLQFSL